MQGLDLIYLFTSPLDELGVDYLVTGSVASIIYGEPRVTHDIDIVVDISSRDASRLADAFPLDDFYCPPVEVIRLEALRGLRGHFNLIHHQTGYKADIYPKSNQPLHRWALERRRLVELPEGSLWVAPPEYVILRKLEYFKEGGSEKHLRDIRGMLQNLGDDIDREALSEWIERLGLDRRWVLAQGIDLGIDG